MPAMPKEEAENARVTNKGDIPREHFQKRISKSAGRDRTAKSFYPRRDTSPPESFDDSLSSTVYYETECTTALETILNPVEVVPWAKERWVGFMYPHFATL
jgi:hypothetical protein